MRIPKFFHPVLGIIIGAILFLFGLTVLSCVFVLAYKGIQYARALLTEIIT